MLITLSLTLPPHNFVKILVEAKKHNFFEKGGEKRLFEKEDTKLFAFSILKEITYKRLGSKEMSVIL